MIALADTEVITAALGGSSTSHMGEPGNRSLLKWKLQVKIMTTRITVIRRFARKYSAKSFQCQIAPGLTAASPQLISKVKDLLEKSNSSVGSKTRNLSAGALFSPNAPVQDAPKQKAKLRTSEKKNGAQELSFKMVDVFKDNRALSTIQLLLTLLTFQILKEADLLDEAIGGLVIVTVIALDSRQEGTTATYNHVVRTVLKGLLILLWLSTFEKSGVNAQDDSEDGKLERPNERVDLPYNVLVAAWTFVVGIFMIVVIAGRINRRPVVTETPATAAAPLAVRLPVAAPLALPAAAAAPPAIPVPAADPLAMPPVALARPAVLEPVADPLAMPPGALAPPAVPVPAADPLAMPPVALAPPAVLEPAADPLAMPPVALAPPAVLEPAADPLAMPPVALAPPAVLEPAADPLAMPPVALAPPAVLEPAADPLAMPPVALAPPAVPVPVPVPAIPIGFIDVMDGLEANLDAARISDPNFYICPPLDEFGPVHRGLQ